MIEIETITVTTTATTLAELIKTARSLSEDLPEKYWGNIDLETDDRTDTNIMQALSDDTTNATAILDPANGEYTDTLNNINWYNITLQTNTGTMDVRVLCQNMYHDGLTKVDDQ